MAILNFIDVGHAFIAMGWIGTGFAAIFRIRGEKKRHVELREDFQIVCDKLIKKIEQLKNLKHPIGPSEEEKAPLISQEFNEEWIKELSLKNSVR